MNTTISAWRNSSPLFRAFSLLLIAASLQLAAQQIPSPEIRGEPKQKPLDFEGTEVPVAPLAFKLAQKIPMVSLAALPQEFVQHLQEEDSLAKGRLRVGLLRDLDTPVTLSGTVVAGNAWSASAGGGKVWATRIDVPGAAGIRVHLEWLKLPPGCRLLVYDANKVPKLVVPATSESLPAKTDVWLPTVFAESMILELQLRPEVDPAEVGFTLKQLAHIYLPLADLLAKAGTCHNDVSCYGDWVHEAAGVALMQFQEGYDTLLCTGALISDADPNTYIDYFLTANHCIRDASAAASLECFWFYQTSACGGAPPDISTVPRTYGADYLAGKSDSDGTLLRLRQRSPGGVYYLGWSTATPAGTLTCIHHPDGAYKRISFGGLSASSASMWTVQWASGVTEQGSSGGPLFDANHRIVGQLYGGPSSCTNPQGTDDFGRFNANYPAFAPWINSAPLANDYCSGAIALSDNVYYSENTGRAANDRTPGLGTCPAGVWFKFTAPVDGAATVDTCGSDFDTLLEVMSGACGALISEGSNDESTGCGLQAALTWGCVAGKTYFICAGGYGGATGNLKVRVHATAGAPARFAKTGTPVINGTLTESITVASGAPLGGTFSCWATNRQYVPGTYVVIVGLVNSFGQCVGGSPQPVYVGAPSSAGELLSVSWSGLNAPASGGTYKLRFKAYPGGDAAAGVTQFTSAPPVNDSGKDQGLIAGVTVPALQPWQLWWKNYSGIPAFWNMDGTNCCSFQQLRLNTTPVAAGWNAVAQGDFSGEGATDLLWQHTNGWVAVWFLDGTNCWRQSRVGSVPAGPGWRAAAAGDLDGDGQTDILFQHTSGLTAVWFLNGTNIVGQARLNAPVVSPGWRLAAAADFNNDGRIDLLWQHSTGITAVWFMNGVNRIGTGTINAPPVDAGWQIVGVTRLFDPLETDILWEHDNGTLAYWEMNGLNRLSTGRLNPARVDPSWRIVGPR